MPDPLQLGDPWSIEASTAHHRGPTHVRARALAAWALSLGVLIQFWAFGGRSWPPTLAAAAIALAMEAAVRAGRGGPVWVPGLRVTALAVCVAAAAKAIGPTPAALLAVVVVLADGAIVSWPPVARWPQRTQATAGLAVGAIVAAELTWFRAGSRTTVLVLLSLSLGFLELYARAPQVTEGIERGVLKVARAVATVVILITLGFVSIVALYLPGAVVRVVRAPRARRRAQASNWQPVSTTVEDDRRQVLRPFATTDPRLRARRTRWGLAAVAALTAVTVLISQAVVDARRSPAPGEVAAASSGPAPSGPKPPAGTETTLPAKHQIFATELQLAYDQLPAYAGVSWANDLQAEQSERVVDGNQVGTYRNIRHGFRVTKEPPRCKDCPELTVWLSGGSAAFGEGQRDDHTIASDLVRLAAEDGITMHVQNHSHDGYTFPMEAKYEIEPSLRTEDPPDLIVFYDGWNDLVAELAAEYLHGPKREVATILPTDLEAINRDTDNFLRSGIGPAAGKAAAARYLATKAEVDAAAEEAGAQTANFFQADALISANQVAPYKLLVGLDPEDLIASPLGSGLETMAEALQPEVENLRGLFADVDDSVFLGLVHQSEQGAQLVAEQMYRSLRPRIRDLAR